ncbi:MAG: DUF5337 family protein [Pseudomonadota bacterium]
MQGSDKNGGFSAQGKQLALLIAGTAIAYIGLQLIGAQQGWSNRAMAFFDLAALAVFGFALVRAFLIWRSGQS